VRTKGNNRVPSTLIDSSSDLRLATSFIEFLIHRRLIYSGHVEDESQPSIYTEVIPMILPIFSLLLKWDGKKDNQLVTFYHRIGRQLEARVQPLDAFNDPQIEFNNIRLMSLIERENFVRRLLSVTNDPIEIHSDYYLWLLLIRRWYTTRKLSPVYLYAIIISFIRSIFLTSGSNSHHENSLQQVESLLSIPFDINRFQMLIKNEIRRNIFDRLNRMIEYSHRQKTFNVNVIHEFNCLQTTLMIGWQINDFFDRPFSTQIQPQHFLCGSLLYAFIDRYENAELNLTDAIDDLLLKEPILLTVLQTLLKCII
jgi:hypothetical protein